MEVRHPKFRSYYVRIDFDNERGFTFDPHYLEVPLDIVATITWFTNNPAIEFTGFLWCDENAHCSQHPLRRRHCMVGAVHTDVAAGDVYWKYQVRAKFTEGRKTRRVASAPCSQATDGLPAIRPK